MSIEKVFDSRPARNLRNVVGTVRAVLLVGGALLVDVGVAASYISIDSMLAAGIASGSLVGLMGIAITLYVMTRYYDPPHYEVLEIEGSLTIERIGDHHRFTYVKRQKVKVLRNNLRLVEFRTHWTGRGSNMYVEPLVDGHVLLDGVAYEDDGRRFRWVYPEGPVRRGQTLETGLRQVHTDDIATQRPYYREGGGKYSTRKLTIVARFPIDEDPHPVEGGVWNTRLPVGEDNRVGVVDYRREVDRAAKMVNYVVTVDNPKRHHSYGIKWRWN